MLQSHPVGGWLWAFLVLLLAAGAEVAVAKDDAGLAECCSLVSGEPALEPSAASRGFAGRMAFIIGSQKSGEKASWDVW